MLLGGLRLEPSTYQEPLLLGSQAPRPSQKHRPTVFQSPYALGKKPPQIGSFLFSP